MDKIKIGILGYGNIGRGVECAIKQNPDTELAAIYTRRDPSAVRPLTDGVKVYNVSELENKQEKLIEENKKLVSDIAVLSSADRIEKIAVEELGMHKAETEDIVRVEMTGEKK